jgi:3-methyladenine DNA glycosylase AlkC
MAQIEMQFHTLFLRKSIAAFLNDDNDECDELEGALLDTFQKDSDRVNVFIAGLLDECGTMKEEISSLNEEVNW